MKPKNLLVFLKNEKKTNNLRINLNYIKFCFDNYINIYII